MEDKLKEKSDEARLRELEEALTNSTHYHPDLRTSMILAGMR
jgi:hypothetical protein